MPLSAAWNALWFRKRYHLLNYLIHRYNYSSYLEIGVRDPRNNFEKIRIAAKEAVDPAPLRPIAHPMTSDAFFAKLEAEQSPRRFDLVFVDGLHLAEQVEKDVDNALGRLNDGGSVVLHDCNPPSADAQSEDFDGKKPVWTGTVWKAWVKLRATREDLSMCVVDIDLGCGVIRRGGQKRYPAPTLEYSRLDYAFLDRNRREALNLVSVDHFCRRFCP